MVENGWEDFGWQGLRLRVPTDWSLGRVDGDAEKGYARLDDAEIVRAEIEWRKLKGREVGVPLSDLVDRYLEGLKKKADKAGAGFEVQRRARFLREKQWLDGYDYELFTWDADFRAFNLALRFVSTQRVILLRILTYIAFKMGLHCCVKIYTYLIMAPLTYTDVYVLNDLILQHLKAGGHERYEWENM